MGSSPQRTRPLVMLLGLGGETHLTVDPGRLEVELRLSWLMITHDNFCWAHRSLREEIAPRKYLRRSPAVAAGLVDHVWTVAELLTMRLPGRR